MDATGDVTSRVDHALREAAARAYKAAHGSLGEDLGDAEPPRWRWDVSPRVIVTLGIVAAIIGVLVVWAPRPTSAAVSIPLEMGQQTPGPSHVSAAGVSAAGVGDAGVSDAVVTVHVAGAVKRPGVYALPVGSRVTDALDVAGGPIAGAQLDSINLARQVSDGEQVRVPAEGETGASGGLVADGRININTAQASQLEGLPGVGPVLADRIVTHREQHGPFASVEGLESVTGLGPAIVAGLAESATV